MLICVPDVLSKDEVAEFRDLMDAADWEDGRSTAGAQSAEVKRNEQLPVDGEISRMLGKRIVRALTANPLFLSAAIPAAHLSATFQPLRAWQAFRHPRRQCRSAASYLTGLRIRTDLSATLFLSEPDTYDGGELVVEDRYGTQEIKLPAAAISCSIRRRACTWCPPSRAARASPRFFWIQSMVRDAHARSLIFDLDTSIQALCNRIGRDDPETVKLTGVYHNLIRYWAEV